MFNTKKGAQAQTSVLLHLEIFVVIDVLLPIRNTEAFLGRCCLIIKLPL